MSFWNFSILPANYFKSCNIIIDDILTKRKDYYDIIKMFEDAEIIYLKLYFLIS